VQSVHDGDLTELAEFKYLGVPMPALTQLPEPVVQRRWKMTNLRIGCLDESPASGDLLHRRSGVGPEGVRGFVL
jgi:hypothetical protein